MDANVGGSEPNGLTRQGWVGVFFALFAFDPWRTLRELHRGRILSSDCGEPLTLDP